jgi:hypothetical protein
VDEILNAYKPAALAKSLGAKYGTAPAFVEASLTDDAAARGGVAAAGEGYTPENRKLLEEFYLKHDPGKVGTVDKILGAYIVDRLARCALRLLEH